MSMGFEPTMLRTDIEAELARTPWRVSAAQPQLHVVESSRHPDDSPEDWELVPGRPRVLIVDGEPVTAQLARVLAKACQIQVVPSAALILEAARQPDQHPDLILLNIMAPAREGLELCRQLKADEVTQSVPVVLITDRDHAEDEARALELGADDCIPRPFRLDVAEARIRNQLRIKIRNDLLERYANQDSLTEVANRRCFDLTLAAEWRRAIRDRQPLSLVMVDVDCFKQFNDRYGHREGDHCLRRLAKAMDQALTRPGDLVARYGGEEFVAILPGTALEGARWLGERLRNAVLELHIPQQRHDGIRQVTISVGCASVQPNANGACYSLLQVADEQLYLAKHSGRNCVRGQTLRMDVP
jgi:diguanylate cyclase (GGDEF)-like protein